MQAKASLNNALCYLGAKVTQQFSSNPDACKTPCVPSEVKHNSPHPQSRRKSSHVRFLNEFLLEQQHLPSNTSAFPPILTPSHPSTHPNPFQRIPPQPQRRGSSPILLPRRLGICYYAGERLNLACIHPRNFLRARTSSPTDSGATRAGAE
jgi:hypothetical protein